MKTYTEADWHKLDIKKAIEELKTGLTGLSSSEAKDRLAKFGLNEIVEKPLKSPWLMLWEQLTSVLVLLLIVASIISAFLGDLKDTIAILAIVVLNAALGVNQEWGAEKAVAALKKMAVPIVKVKRDGEVKEISARELVPGDIVFLEAGNFVPADCRLIEAVNLRTQEASLTGESEPVEKTIEPIMKEDIQLGDRTNMVYMGTSIAYGRGTAVVVETGMATELGVIAKMIEGAGEEGSPLEKRMDDLGKWLVAICVALVTVVFFIGLLRGNDVRTMFLTAVSLAVAAVPEGLPAIVTIALALGAQRMLKRKALIRKLPAVETLGSVTVICSDKTGTLTENKMTVTVLDIAGKRIEFEKGHGEIKTSDSFKLLLKGASLCNDTVLKEGLKTLGDPTETALVVAAAKAGLIKNELERLMPRVAELPFDAGRKRMTTVHQQNSGFIAFTKGAVDGLLEVCSQVLNGEHVEALDGKWKERITKANNSLAEAGTRVLGVAYRTLSDPRAIEKDLIFIGMIGMIDPPRPEVKEAVEKCKTAGIRPIMITGDHPLTAKNIALELGMAGDGSVLTGAELEKMSVDELSRAVEKVSIYARVSPEHKLKIVTALKRGNQIVAMTGDGINDAPALKEADIGVSMGITGTDVAREASDMVLLDDNFATIVRAVEEGRVIYDNIRKFVKYLLAANSAEIWLMLFAPFLGMPLPLLPLQLLWINLVTDGLPALALGIEPAEPGTMKRPPYKTTENFFARDMGFDIVWIGAVMAVISIGTGFFYWSHSHPSWQTLIFTLVVFSEMALSLSLRSEKESLLKLGIFTNMGLIAAVASTVVLQAAVIYIPILQGIFRTKALTSDEFLACIVLSAAVFFVVEGSKLFRRSKV